MMMTMIIIDDDIIGLSITNITTIRFVARYKCKNSLEEHVTINVG